MKRWLGGGIVVLLLGVLVWSLSKGGSPANADVGAPASNDPLIVHEWGTFTSYSGSDGGRLEFRPLFDDDLPHFVLERSLGAGLLTKSNYRALVRMETPITYFYTKEPRDVRVKVNFPQGLLTEFYPPVAAISPPYKGASGEPKTNSSLDWGTIRLIPETHLRPNMADDRLADVIAKRTAAALPPHADYQNHYAFARQTDSAIVHIHRPADPAKPFSPHGDFFEKFLFYRGLGDFKLPIRVQALGEGKALVNNSGAEPIAWMMLLDVSGDTIKYSTFDGVAAGQQRAIALPVEVSSPEQMTQELTTALTSTGLYRREAEAMVNTWRSSWFGEQGTRLLYFVPEMLTDELLPLTIDPKPAETVRVLVGRLDLMTPEQEASVTKLVAESAAARAIAYQQAREAELPVKYDLPDSIRNLGRLAEPALTRVRHVSTDLKLSNEAGYLIEQLRSDAAGK